MRPNFTLSLSFSGIQLLHRQNGGWGRVGDVDLATADLSGDLAALLDKARALNSGPVETKLIVPDEQIKYLTVDAGGLDKTQLQSAVLDALDGATPYAVDELEFDFANENGSVYIAAVAKETLQEAEAFASEHGFEPMGFVAAPPADKFPKEPNFGLSTLAISQGRPMLETDAHPAVATGEAVANTPAPAAAPVEPSVAEPEPQPAPEPQPEPQEPAVAATPVPGFSSRRAAPSESAAPVVAPVVPETAQSAPRLDGVQREKTAELPLVNELPPATQEPPLAEQVPEITGRSEAALSETEVDASLGALRPGAAFDDGFDDIPPMPAGFAAAPPPDMPRGAADGAPMADLRAPALARTPPHASTPPRVESEPKPTGNGGAAKAAALAGTVGSAALSGARSLFKKRAKAAEPAATPEVAAAQEDEKQRMTVFGARKPKKKKEEIEIGGKPRFLGLILTAILLLFLVSVAAWASVFLDDGLARFFGGSDRDRAIAELPNPESAPAEEELIELAALDGGIDDITLNELPGADGGLSQVQPPPAPPVISPEEAEAKYAATGIWLATPAQPTVPGQISLDDVYLASIDTRITGQDAFAMEPLALPRDQMPQGVAAPPPADSPFTFDENGLVVATPEGVVTPEGALVFLGRPARVPPAVPERLRTAIPDAADAPQEATPETALSATLRPRLRPEALVENTERTQLGGNTRAELARLRPKMRPKVEKEVAETEAAQAPATKLAISSSRKPSQRPRNFARIVSRAQKQAERQAEPQATRVAAVAPRTVTPRIPSSASVAKSATVKNAINLSRVNLIGVYGKPSSRRALVRLSSGRYKKVKIGDRVDGGRVSAIGEAQLIYTKGGRSVTLRMPKG